MFSKKVFYDVSNYVVICIKLRGFLSVKGKWVGLIFEVLLNLLCPFSVSFQLYNTSEAPENQNPNLENRWALIPPQLICPPNHPLHNTPATTRHTQAKVAQSPLLPMSPRQCTTGLSTTVSLQQSSSMLAPWL